MKKAKVKIVLCLGSSCHSRGNDKSLKVLKQYVAQHQLEDEVDLRGQLCSGNCKDGPILHINDKVYREVSENSIGRILDEYFMRK